MGIKNKIKKIFDKIDERTKDQAADAKEKAWPAVMDELQSGKVPPYLFQAAFVQIVFSKSNLQLQNQIAHHEILDMYGARVSKNDDSSLEIIIKQQNKEDCRLLALSCVRDLFRLNFLTDAKTLICFGDLEFDDKNSPGIRYHLNSNACALPLIPSLKSGIYFLKDLKDIFSPLVKFSVDQEMFYVTEFFTVLDVLETYLPIERASYFRLTSDISQTLSYISEKIVEGDLAEINEAFFFLKRFKVSHSSPDLVNAYKSLLNLLLRLYKTNSDMKYLLSSCISVSIHLISVNSFDDEIKELLQWCLQFQDPRIKANCIEALGYFDPHFPAIKTYTTSKFNRIAAESILILGRKSLDEEVTKKILSFLSSPNPYFVASGLYLISNLVEYHFCNDYGYFIKNKNFNKLIQRALMFQNHPHSMVRQRAQKTISLIDSLRGAA